MQAIFVSGDLNSSAHNPVIDETACVLCQLFPEQVQDHARLHHKLDIQDGNLVELPIEPPPDKKPPCPSCYRVADDGGAITYPCALRDGHEGPHTFSITWANEDAK